MISGRMSAEYADALLHCEKRLSTNQTPVVDLSHSKTRIMLVSDMIPAQFLFEFSRISLELKKVTYHMQTMAGTGLTRFDFGGRHINPKAENVAPEIARPYTGKRFEGESHIHIYSENVLLRQLEWAVPPEALGMHFGTTEAGRCDIRQVLNLFCEYIALKDRIIFQGALNE